MRRVGGGRIICIGGASSRMSSKRGLPQGLGNAALANFAKHLSDEVAPHQILVNVVHPSFTRTDRFPSRLAARAQELGVSQAEAEASFAAEVPIGRIIEPADIASLVPFLASRHAGASPARASPWMAGRRGALSTDQERGRRGMQFRPWLRAGTRTECQSLSSSI